MGVLEPVAWHGVGDGEVVVGFFAMGRGGGGGIRSGGYDDPSENHVCE